MSGGSIKLRHSGLSQGEVEILFSLLSDPYDVSDNPVEDFSSEYVSMLGMDFPLAYERGFFKNFGIERWERIKEVLKNLKWRRGKKGILLSLRFSGAPSVTFSLNTDDNKTFNRALETIEYLMDVILFQIDSKRLPADVSEVSYAFDERESRWYPAKAVGNSAEYVFVNEEWRTAGS